LDRITTTIERRFLAAIIAGTKRVEYRELKPYWTKRLSKVKPPFELRLINGMQARAPEVTVVIGRIKESRKNGEYELHIRQVKAFKNWNKRKQEPARGRGRK
jgi:hypothetical protein